MGKGNLIIGTASKKLGDIVFYRTGGEQRFRVRVKPMNPRTNAQLLQRCVVSTAVKFYSNVADLCNHAFQNYTGSLKNHQRFMKLNIMKLRPVALSQVVSFSPIRFSDIDVWNWAKKDDPNSYVNPYILSEGDLGEMRAEWKEVGTGSGKYLPSLAILKMEEEFPTSAITYKAVADFLGLKEGDQLTFINVAADPTTGAITRTAYARIILSPSEGDWGNTQMFNSAAGDGVYTINKPNKENYGTIQFMIDTQKVSSGATTTQTATLSYTTLENSEEVNNIAGTAIIVSRFENNRWRRSNSVMNVLEKFQNLSPLQEAMASYEKSDTSSLYLNQAQNAQTQELMQAYAEEFGTVVEEIPEEPAKKSKK